MRNLMRRMIEGCYHHVLIQSECKIKQPPGCCLFFLVLWPFQSGQTTIKRQEITAGDFSFSDLTQRIQEYHFIYSLYMFWSCNMLVYRQALFQRWAFNQTHYLQFIYSFQQHCFLVKESRCWTCKIKLQHSICCVQCPDFFGNRFRNDERIQSSLGPCAIQHNRT